MTNRIPPPSPSSIASTFAQIVAKLSLVSANQRHLISAINQRASYRELLQMANQGETDLQAAVASLQSFATTVAAELTTLEAAAANATGDPDADIETLAQQVKASVATIQAAMPASMPAPAPGTT